MTPPLRLYTPQPTPFVFGLDPLTRPSVPPMLAADPPPSAPAEEAPAQSERGSGRARRVNEHAELGLRLAAQLHGGFALALSPQALREPGAVQTAPSTSRVGETASVDRSPAGIDRQVQTSLERTMSEMQNIPVRVRGPDGSEQTVTVHPPYVMNETDHMRECEAHRDALSGDERDVLRRRNIPVDGEHNGYLALHGKASPEQIRQILQNAADRGVFGEHPTSEQMARWLHDNGVGMDCTGFATQAMNRVFRDLGSEARVGETGTGSLGLGSQRNVVPVEDLASLRPGDTMILPPSDNSPGHIRVVMAVSRDEDGSLRFTTGESSSGRDRIGPVVNEWRAQQDARGRWQMEVLREGEWRRQNEGASYFRPRALGELEAPAE